MLLIGNGRLITRGEKNRLIERGALLIDGPLIKEVGETAPLRAAYPGLEFIDARGGLILPGLINAHTHVYSAFARGLSIEGYQPRSFSEILSGLWWRLDSLLTEEDVYWSAMAAFLDSLKQGCATVFDHHASYGCIQGSLDAIAEAAGHLGLRANLCYEVSDRAGEEAMRAALAENLAFIQRTTAADNSMLKSMMGLHASFTLSERTLELVREQTPAETGFHIHVAEGPEDQQDCFDKYGQRVVERLQRHGLLGEHSVAGHCIHVNEQELNLLQESKTVVVHNPQSNMSNAVGIPPCLEMLRRGMLLCLGTDGYTNDMLESAKVANIIHKHEQHDAAAGATAAAQMLFANNARMASRSFGLRLGELAPGAAADIIICDYDPPTPCNADNCDGHILFGLSGRGVVTNIINGQVRMREREFSGVDEAEIMAKCREQARQLARRINSRHLA